MTSNEQTQPLGASTPPAIVAEPPGLSPGVLQSAGSIAEPTAQQVALNSRTLSRQEIRKLQAKLKLAGFYTGALDGIAGPKTRAALSRLQSGCATITNDLETPSGSLLSLASHSPKEEIPVLQVRLKNAGFDPGPIDGIAGGKTTAALKRAESACLSINSAPVVIAESFQTADQGSKKQMQLAVYTSPAHAGSQNAVDSMLDGATSKREIRRVQLTLKEAGFDPGPIDGIYGPKTTRAVQQYRIFISSKSSGIAPSRARAAMEW